MSIATHWNIWRRAFGRGVFPPEMCWYLELPLRRLIMSPRVHADRLNLREDHQVLELGPGSGYYSSEVAARLPSGRLHLLDVQQGMLDRAESRLGDSVSYALSDGVVVPYPAKVFDRIYLVTVFGEIEEPTDCLAELRRVLKDDGVLSISEHHPDADFEFRGSLLATLADHGFAAESSFGWPLAYTQNFCKQA